MQWHLCLNPLDLNESKEENEDITALIRPLIISAMGKYNNKTVINESLKRYREYMKLYNSSETKENAKSVLSSNIRASVFGIAMKYGTKEDFYLLKDYYLKASDPAEISWSLRSLSLTRDPELIKETLNWILTSEKVKPQDKVFPFRTIGSTLAGRQIAYDFLKEHIKEWFKIFEGGFLIQHLVKIPNSFVSFEKANEIEKYYSGIKDQQSCQRSMKQCVENIRKYAKWQQKDIKLIQSWCTEQSQKD